MHQARIKCFPIIGLRNEISCTIRHQLLCQFAANVLQGQLGLLCIREHKPSLIVIEMIQNKNISDASGFVHLIQMHGLHT